MARAAVLREIAGRGDDVAGDRRQAARAERAVGQIGDAQRDVDARRDDIDPRVGQPQVDLHRRVRGHEVGDRGRDMAEPEGHRRGDADQPGGRAGGVVRGFLGGVAFGEDALGVLGQRVPGSRSASAGARCGGTATCRATLRAG